jgi:hypothetical protein
MTLIELQQGMREWLQGEEGAATAFGRERRAGLDVYRNNYRAQLVACLTEKYERVVAWLGDAAFEVAAARQIGTSPPHDWTLDRYGADFPQTLQSLYPDDPEVAELAWLDGALTESFVGPDVEPVSPQTLAEVDWDSATLTFTPTLRTSTVQTNSTAIWSALSAGGTPPAVELLHQPATVIVWRKELTSCFRTLDATETDAMLHVQMGGTFGSLCAMLVEREGDEAGIRIAGECLARWMRDGLVVRVG